MRFQLSEKSQEAVIKAAEMVDTLDLSCCTALRLASCAVGLPERGWLSVVDLFGHFYGKHTSYSWFPNDSYESAREARVLLLLAFLEASR